MNPRTQWTSASPRRDECRRQLSGRPLQSRGGFRPLASSHSATDAEVVGGSRKVAILAVSFCQTLTPPLRLLYKMYGPAAERTEIRREGGSASGSRRGHGHVVGANAVVSRLPLVGLRRSSQSARGQMRTWRLPADFYRSVPRTEVHNPWSAPPGRSPTRSAPGGEPAVRCRSSPRSRWDRPLRCRGSARCSRS